MKLAKMPRFAHRNPVGQRLRVEWTERAASLRIFVV
jgi:hypothetical protein